MLAEGHDPTEVIDVDAAMPGLVASESRMAQTMRPLMYVSCWYANEHESMAMWRLYGEKSGGVAIQTSLLRLKAALDPGERIWSGMVAYVDQSKHPVSHPQFPAIVVVKRPAYASEREFRIGVSYINDRRDEPGSTDADLAFQPSGVEVPVDPTGLLTRNVVSPDAGAAFIEAVVALGSKYGVSAPIGRSSLLAPPHF